VPAAAWRAVAGAPATCALVVATYDGQWGPNPVRIGAEHWPELPTDGDEGARGLLRRLRERVCAVACVGSAADIDTPEDLARWTSS
jgi:molybdenum cofactor cytidylyltransferase